MIKHTEQDNSQNKEFIWANSFRGFPPGCSIIYSNSEIKSTLRNLIKKEWHLPGMGTILSSCQCQVQSKLRVDSSGFIPCEACSRPGLEMGCLIWTTCTEVMILTNRIPVCLDTPSECGEAMFSWLYSYSYFLPIFLFLYSHFLPQWKSPEIVTGLKGHISHITSWSHDTLEPFHYQGKWLPSNRHGA